MNSAAGTTYECWRHRPTGRLWAVKLVDSTVIAACGPLAKHDVFGPVIPYLPFSTREMDWLRREEANFSRA
jgi:hypothetical protein